MLSVAGIPVFDDLMPWQFAVLAAGYFVAFIVKGLFGYGAVPPMILSGSLVMSPHHAVLLAGLVNLGTQGFMVPEGLRHGDRRIALRAIACILPALVVGVVIFNALPPNGLQVAVGLFLTTFLLLENTNWHGRVMKSLETRPTQFEVISATIAGLIAGIIGAGAMIFFSIYLRTVLSDRFAFRGTIVLIITAILVFRTMLFLGIGLVTLSLVVEALLFLPLTVVALFVGRAFVGRLSDTNYFRIYKAFMILACMLLLVRGLI